jgi:peptide/nickel transport system permease protein
MAIPTGERPEAEIAVFGSAGGAKAPLSGARRSRRSILARAGSTSAGKIGLVGIGIIVFIAVAGPWLAPHSITQVIGKPYLTPRASAPLGTDYLGRDVLSRWLQGGRVIPLIALASTVGAYVIGGSIGLVSGIRRGGFDIGAMWIVDVFLSIPPLIAALALLTALGRGDLTTGIAIAAVFVAPIVRIVRAATFEVVKSEYVEAAVARGERTLSIALREILPNIRTTVVADFGVRVAYATILFASLSFLSLGPEPPTADWGLMVSENSGGLLINPWAVIVPAITIALMSVSVMLVADSIARSIGRTVLRR